jgi:hypothetical protein
VCSCCSTISVIVLGGEAYGHAWLRRRCGGARGSPVFNCLFFFRSRVFYANSREQVVFSFSFEVISVKCLQLWGPSKPVYRSKKKVDEDGAKRPLHRMVADYNHDDLHLTQLTRK